MGVFNLFRGTEKRELLSIRNHASDGWSHHMQRASSAEGHATAVACVNAISGTIASLPAAVYNIEDGRRSEATDHPLNRLITTGANAHQTWADFIEIVLSDVLINGNALAEIVTSVEGTVTELKPIPWRSVSVSQTASGRLAYDFVEPALNGSTGLSRRLLEDDVLHLKDRSDNGLVGVPRLRRAAMAGENATRLDMHTGLMYENGGRPGGFLTAEGKLSEQSAMRLKQSWNSLFSGAGRGRTAVLEHGLKYEAFDTFSPEDQEILNARRFTVEEIARVFGVPPVMVGDLSNSSFTNSETMLRFFAQSTLTQWCRKIETEFSRSVFSDSERGSFELDVDLSGLLRGDPETRWNAHQIAIDSGVLDPEEVREIEGFDRREGATASQD